MSAIFAYLFLLEESFAALVEFLDFGVNLLFIELFHVSDQRGFVRIGFQGDIVVVAFHRLVVGGLDTPAGLSIFLISIQLFGLLLLRKQVVQDPSRCSGG